VVALGVLALVAAYLASLALAAIPLFTAAAFGTGVFTAIAPLVVLGVLCAVAFVLLVLEVTGACALCAIVVEGCAARPSVRATFDRILNRREFGRALLCAITVAAIGLLASTVVNAVAVLLLAPWPAAYVTLDAVERTLVVPLLAAVLAVYYFDVRRSSRRARSRRSRRASPARCERTGVRADGLPQRGGACARQALSRAARRSDAAATRRNRCATCSARSPSRADGAAAARRRVVARAAVGPY
jgi:hypothetical protein